MDYQVENIIIVYTIVIIFWLLTVMWREFNDKDIELYRKNILLGFNGWSLLHFINYLFLGYFAPDYIIQVIVIGIIFELMEIPLGMFVSKYIDSKILMDTLVNTIGTITGYLIYKKYPKKIELRKELLMDKMFVHFGL
tara:strand:- start:371 stop:784 length:414 start_codon:yes stop_codon:yes gene_type:complete